MAIDRRGLLRLLAGGVLWSGAGAPGRASAGGLLYLSARADPAGGYRVGGFSPSGGRAFDLPLPARGHAFAAAPGGREAVLFARRPGRFALALDLARGAVTRRFEAPADRHFYGHGAFAPDGRLLYASENDFDGERGVIGVYDAARGYRRAGELASHGVGPHEVAPLSDGATLAVANGGILTRPDLPRVKLNLADMAPSLCFVDRISGRLLREDRLAPGLNRLGIRHLAVGADDTVAAAMQYEGPAGDLAPLAALAPRGGRLRPLEAPAEVWRAMKRYCGAAAFDSEGRILAVSAPRGNLLAFWDAGSGAWLAAARLADCCGVAPAGGPGAFVASGGAGDVAVVRVRGRSAETAPLATGFPRGGRWDNHLAAVGG